MIPRFIMYITFTDCSLITVVKCSAELHVVLYEHGFVIAGRRDVWRRVCRRLCLLPPGPLTGPDRLPLLTALPPLISVRLDAAAAVPGPDLRPSVASACTFSVNRYSR